jgi:SAM-dependent methyltransferase
MNTGTKAALKAMDETYWNKVAQDYDSEIFCALANDRNDIIASKISNFRSKSSTAHDFGCGVGKFLPILAENFRCVYALDISDVCLQQARDICKDFQNITYLKLDLTANSAKLKKAHFGLSVNVLIMPSEEKRTAILKTISKHLYKAGHLLLVVPSLESAFYADFRLIQWNLRTGLKTEEAVSELEQPRQGSILSLRQGIVKIEGVPTKHYLAEELLAMFQNGPFDVLSIEKVEYPWATEFERPPKWMKEPFPWDWLVVLKKVKT